MKKTNANKNLAIALKYIKEQMDAPEIVAKGQGDIAKAIIEIAKKHKIPIESNEELAEILSMAQTNEQIPIESFAAVAGILGKIYEIDAR